MNTDRAIRRLLAVSAFAGILVCGTVRQGQAATTVEARFVRDSTACPVAVDLWLRSVQDTIAGYELVIQWDRPGFATFQLDSASAPDTAGGAAASEKSSSHPSLRGPSKEPSPVIDLMGTVSSTWALVTGRTTDGLRLKIVGLMNLFDKGSATPIYPCDSVRLLRLPISLAPNVSSDSAGVFLNISETRLSVVDGSLVPKVTVSGDMTGAGECRSAATRE